MTKIERSDSIRPVQAVDVVLPAAPRPSAASPNVVLAIVCVGICLANLDLFIVNVALPNIGRDFRDDPLEDMSWVLNGYAIAYAALLVLFGRVAERYRRNMSFLLGVDVVIESVGGALTGQALATLALNGVLTSLGYSAGRKTTIDVTDLIWKRASMSGFALAAQSHGTKAAAWATILPLLTSGQVNPIVERTYRLGEAAEALRHLIEDRPFGRVVLVG